MELANKAIYVYSIPPRSSTEHSPGYAKTAACQSTNWLGALEQGGPLSSGHLYSACINFFRKRDERGADIRIDGIPYANGLSGKSCIHVSSLSVTTD